MQFRKSRKETIFRRALKYKRNCKFDIKRLEKRLFLVECRNLYR